MMRDVQQIKDAVLETYFDIMNNSPDPGARLTAAERLMWAVQAKEQEAYAAGLQVQMSPSAGFGPNTRLL
jgi:hypothetical protein